MGGASGSSGSGGSGGFRGISHCRAEHTQTQAAKAPTAALYLLSGTGH